MEDEENFEALVLLSCSLLNRGIADSNGNALAEAKVLFHEALENIQSLFKVGAYLQYCIQVSVHHIFVFGFVTLVGLRSETEEQNCKYKVQELCEKQSEGLQEADPLIELIVQCIDHNCLLYAEKLLYEAQGVRYLIQSNPIILTESNEKTILLAKLALKKGDFESGFEILNTCSFQEGTKASVEIHELKAKALCQVTPISTS